MGPLEVFVKAISRNGSKQTLALTARRAGPSPFHASFEFRKRFCCRGAAPRLPGRGLARGGCSSSPGWEPILRRSPGRRSWTSASRPCPRLRSPSCRWDKSCLSDEPENAQTRERFAVEASRIHDQERYLKWATPSLDEEEAPPLIVDGPEVL